MNQQCSITVRIFKAVLAILVVAGTFFYPGAVQETRAAAYYVRDQFGTVAYNNSNGTVDWSGDLWTEIADTGGAGGGNVQIIGGELRVNSRVATNDADLEGVQRAVNLANTWNDTLSFYFRSTNLEAGDTLTVDIYDSDAVPPAWTTLETLSGTSTQGWREYDLDAYRSAGSMVRFQITGGFDQADESVFFDNVEVSYTIGGMHTATSVLQTVQTYYIPVPEDQVLTSLYTINPNYEFFTVATSPTHVYVSISINASGTVIYYDHWEDDFESAVNNPAQSSTDVWGDDNPANGMPPGYATDYLGAGDIILLNNMVDTTMNTDNWPPVYALKYDGGDKIASTEAIAVTRTGWASGSGTLHGGSVEMLDTSVWGTDFVVPIKNGTNPTQDFEYTGVTIMASRDGTAVELNGTTIANLDEGQSWLINSTLTLGNRNEITSNYPVQVNLLTGNIGSNFESDWLSLYPVDLLGNNYYAPVNSEYRSTTLINTRVYVHNPNADPIIVNWETTAGVQTALNITGNGWSHVLMPDTATGARFYSENGEKFQALSIIDSGGQAHDWGYTLIPANQLTQQVMVGWGVGRDPTSTTLPSQNGSPVWVIAVGSGTMNICADYNGDGQGALTDSNGRRYDQLITLGNLGRTKIYDSDGDQTGMLVYLCNGSETGNVNKIAAAWGQDPATASASAPGLDVGTSVPPLPNFTAIKGAELTGDINGDGKYDVGEAFEYQIKINNTGALPVPAGTITVEDIIPLHTTYLVNSTYIDGVSVPDNGSGTPFPLDEGGYLINKRLEIEGSFLVTFRVQIDSSIPALITIQNDARVSGMDLEYTPNVDIIVDPPAKLGDTIWLDLDGDGTQDPGEPGLPGVTVGLYDASNNLINTATTDANGHYTFAGLADGTYTVRVGTASLPGGLEQTGDPDGCPGAGCDDAVTVTLNSSNKPYWYADFGYQGTASLGDFVWFDEDRDGLQDGGAEVGLAGVTVNLTWAGADGNLATTADNLTFSTQTDSGGYYLFDGLPAGIYTANLDESTLPNNYGTTTPDPLTPISLAVGQDYDTADFGAAPGASIGDYVWHDLDGAGDQDASEGGIEGVRVYIDSNGNGSYDPGERYDITDGNGKYLIGNLPPGTYSLRVDGATVPAGYTATTASPVTVTVAAGGTDLTADFGYQGSVLAISKTSSAAGSTTPGSTIIYTIKVRNNTGQVQTGISVNDPLPGGTTYVANSTQVVGYPVVADTYFDQFNARAYNNSNGTLTWSNVWVEGGGETDGPTAGGAQVVTDGTQSYVLRPGDNPSGTGNVQNRTISRQADLSVCNIGAVLSFDYRWIDLDDNDTINILARLNSSSAWQTLTTFTGNNTTLANYQSYSVDISGYRSATMEIRFSTNFTDGTTADTFYVDNVKITCNRVHPTSVTRDNDSGTANPALADGIPANLVKYEDTFGLLPGQEMTVTYQVAVDDPNTHGHINNTAAVYSVQQPTAQQASTSDALPPSTIGNYVWLDLDNDGVQESNEPPLGGVEVKLTISYLNGYSKVITTTTAADGSYSFGGLYADENFGGLGVSAPTFTVSVDLPAGLTASPANQGGDDALDSEGTSVKAVFYQGVTDNTYDIGLYSGRVDLGDLPPNYPTVFSTGPAHTIFTDANNDDIPETVDGSAAIWLGTLVDAEPDGQPGVSARGDDILTVDDEDGFQFADTGWLPGAISDVTITLNGSKPGVRVYYGLWIDWGANGSFDDANDGFYSGYGVTATSPVDITRTVSVPLDYVANSSVYFRLRASTTALLQTDYQGTLINGEVEDYLQSFSPTAVELISLEAVPVSNRVSLAGSGVLVGLLLLGALWLRKRLL